MEQKQATLGTRGMAALFMLCAVASQTWAQDSNSLAAVFASQDVNGDGAISARELEHFREFLFLSADFDSDGKVSAEEWKNWDPRHVGVSFAEAQIGFAFSAMASIFVTLDNDINGSLSESEMSTGLVRDFAAVDQNQDGLLNRDEFEQSFLLRKEVEIRIENLVAGRPPY